jgi:hypothetical protein
VSSIVVVFSFLSARRASEDDGQSSTRRDVDGERA